MPYADPERRRQYQNAYLKKWRAKRHADGLCHCGNLPVAGTKTCQRCATYLKGYRLKRASQNLCVDCGRQSKAGLKSCTPCAAAKRVRSEECRSVRRSKRLCLSCGAAVTQGAKCDSCKKAAREYLWRVRDDVLDYYGGSCRCCGESRRIFLCIDHVAEDGSHHRKINKINGGTLAVWLKNKGYPEGFQVLCWNCNYAKHALGSCPHQAVAEPNHEHSTPAII